MTNTARHTPGPWVPGIKDGNVEPVVSGGVSIAEMIPTDCTEEEFEANCSLVYAAPLMLEALEAQEWAEYDPEASRRKGYFDRARALRKAALATARGQS
jgi:hypothetical protein